MTKFIIFLFSITTNISAFPQNVGIGTTAPAEKLDVAGNINIQGNLKVNGDAGQPGQVLRVNNDGTQSWASTAGYKYRRVFYTTTTWTVPPGIKEIMIEALGSGGGGAKGGGGGGGGYAIGVFKVKPGNVISITLSPAGSGSATEAGSASVGGDANASFLSEINISGTGGYGAFSTQPGTGGFYSISGDSLILTKGFAGIAGDPTVENYSQRSTSEYVTVRKYGNGGGSGFSPYTFSKGTFLSFNTVTQVNLTLNYGGYTSDLGLGGAGGNTPFGTWGFDGGGGFVAISW